MRVTANRPNITSAAMGNIPNGVFAIHLVNNGATRQVTLAGLPKNIHRLQIYVTDGQQDMKQGTPIKVSNGKATFQLLSTSFTSLMTKTAKNKN